MNKKLLFNSKESGLLFSAFIVAFVIIMLIGQIVLTSFVSADSAVYRCISSLFSPVAAVAVILGFSFYKKGNPLKSLNFNKFNLLFLVPTVFLLFGMFFGLGFLNDLVADFITSIGLKASTSTIPLNSVWYLIYFIITVGLLPAVLEETIFRSVIVTGLKGISIFTVATLSAVAFALYHGSISQLFYQLIYGFALTVLAVKAKSVFPSIICHALNNLVILLLTYFNVVVPFTNLWLILGGICCLAAFSFFVWFLGNNEKKEKTQNEKTLVKEFCVGAALGAVVCVVLIVAGLFG